MLSKKSWICCLVACIAICGCGMLKDVSYFTPAQQENIRVASGIRGLPEIARLQLSKEVELFLIVFDQPQHSIVRIIIHLHSGQIARFDNARILATSSGGGQAIVGEIGQIEANYIVNGQGHTVYLTANDDLIGDTYEYKKGSGGTERVARRFMMDVVFPNPLPDRFLLGLPTLTLSGKTILSPALEFRRKVGSAYQGSLP